MIMDAENTFIYKTDLAGTSQVSDVVMNGAGGDAVQALWLAVRLHEAVSSAATVALITSDVEAMTSPTTLATYNIATTTKEINARLPKGCKKYLRLDFAAAVALTTGNVTGALVLDV